MVRTQFQKSSHSLQNLWTGKQPWLTPKVMKSETSEMPEKPLAGEVSGSFVLGLYESFRRVNCLLLTGTRLKIEEVSPENWYPYSLMIDQLAAIEKAAPISKNIFFQAGIHFLRIWYEHGPGKTMIHSGLDWLQANLESAGYNSVVRGGNPEEIGWCRCLSFDESAGIAVYEDVTPLHPEYVKGVFYGGCILFDDMDFVSVDCTILPYTQNPLFKSKLITVRFRSKPIQVRDELTAKLDSLHLDATLDLSSAEVECLVWRYKGLRYDSALKGAYFEDTSSLLADTLNEVHRLNLELDTANKRLEHLVGSDPLTGISNRRRFVEQAEIECRRALRGKSPLSLLSLDLDHFKRVNDTWGHATGDEVLLHFTRTTAALLREFDLFSRMGGEEFVILLPGTRIEGAEKTAHRILEAIRGETVEFKGAQIRYTVSIGVASLQEDEDNLESLLRRADAALYRAKESGRNRVWVE